MTAAGLLTVGLAQENFTIDEVVVTALGIKRETRGLTYATQQLNSFNAGHNDLGIYAREAAEHF